LLIVEPVAVPHLQVTGIERLDEWVEFAQVRDCSPISRDTRGCSIGSRDNDKQTMLERGAADIGNRDGRNESQMDHQRHARAAVLQPVRLCTGSIGCN
jgi:hypothetical protein